MVFLTDQLICLAGPREGGKELLMVFVPDAFLCFSLFFFPGFPHFNPGPYISDVSARKAEALPAFKACRFLHIPCFSPDLAVKNKLFRFRDSLQLCTAAVLKFFKTDGNSSRNHAIHSESLIPDINQFIRFIRHSV